MMNSHMYMAFFGCDKIKKNKYSLLKSLFIDCIGIIKIISMPKDLKYL